MRYLVLFCVLLAGCPEPSTVPKPDQVISAVQEAQTVGPSLLWERINDDPRGSSLWGQVYRAKMPGGWLIVIEKSQAASMIFVSDGQFYNGSDWSR